MLRNNTPCGQKLIIYKSWLKNTLMSLNDEIKTTLKTGDESFTYSENDLDFRLIDFWKWSTSDLVNNTTRGILAEYIVAKALDIDTSTPRKEWDAYDLITSEGIKIQVKSASYIQSWSQKEYSKISFTIKKSKPWDSRSNSYGTESTRVADVYIFALLDHKDKETINPLNLDQWIFYILHVNDINNHYKNMNSLSLNSLENICKVIPFLEIKEEFHNVIENAGKYRLNI